MPNRFLDEGQQPETTTIPHAREPEFRAWAQRNRITDLDNPESHYDYRGAFLAGVNRGENGHWPDTFKQHGHPTFSVESRYATPGDPSAGSWAGDTYTPPRKGNRFLTEGQNAPRNRFLSEAAPAEGDQGVGGVLGRDAEWDVAACALRWTR